MYLKSQLLRRLMREDHQSLGIEAGPGNTVRPHLKKKNPKIKIIIIKMQ
jgi:hypothetical protein